jgi:hypothetical protein
MGVKSTIHLTRSAAEARYLEAHVAVQSNRRREKLEKRLRDVQMHHLSLPYETRSRIEDLRDDDLREIAIAVDLAGRAASMRQNAMIALADLQDDVRLENDLERVHDLSRDGEGFENYVITASGQDED